MKTGTKQPMRIYPALHYAYGRPLGGFTICSLEQHPGLYVLGEANFSDHGANRLGASALMQGLADGYFVIPYTIADYLARTKPGKVTTDHPEFKRSEEEVAAMTNKAALNQWRDRPRNSGATSAGSCGSTWAWRAAKRA
jgi:succinate dehydrogenase / fumarate reductase flavoprotein subunit